MKNAIRWAFRRAGYEVLSLHRPAASSSLPYDYSPDECATYARVRPFTLTSADRVVSLIRAVQYVVASEIPGALVECGVWKGGSAMAMALTLQQLHADRDVFLYDVFGKVPAPVAADGDAVAQEWRRYDQGISQSWPLIDSLSTVRTTMACNGCDLSRICFIPGRVEDTIPEHAPDTIALLRLDTDFYESTRHELQHLYPRLSPGGILIIDDYVPFPGCRKAVDEYLSERHLHVFLNRIDADARLIVKPWDGLSATAPASARPADPGSIGR